jgi:hypothetical protein
MPRQYLGFASGLISYACFTIYYDRKEFNRLTKEIDAKNNKYRTESKTK